MNVTLLLLFFFFFSFFFLSFFFFVFGGWGWESSCKFSCVFKAFSFLKYDFCPISPAVQTSERIREREREREREASDFDICLRTSVAIVEQKEQICMFATLI